MSIAITGATGELGTLVIRHLLEKVPANRITAVVRNLEKASTLRDLGIGVRYGDYGKPESLPDAFAGTAKLLFISSPDSDDTLRIVQHANVVKAARDAGVRHMAYTGFAFAEQSAIPLAHVHLATEQAIRTTNIPYTFLRNALYTEVFVNPGLGAAIEQGTLITNTGNGKLNTVSRNDLARAAAAVLTEEGHENKTYNLVSDQLWNFDELARIISDITGRQVTHRAVSLEEHRRILSDQGLPEPVVAMVTGVHNAVASGETSRTSADLRKLIGSPAPLNETVKQALQP